MFGLGFKLALAAIVTVSAAAWYDQGRATEAAQDAFEAPVELELAGLATPSTEYPGTALQADARTVLAPSCDIGVPGACDRLEAVCADLRGAIADNRDGTLTCLLILD